MTLVICLSNTLYLSRSSKLIVNFIFKSYHYVPLKSLSSKGMTHKKEYSHPQSLVHFQVRFHSAGLLSICYLSQVKNERERESEVGVVEP